MTIDHRIRATIEELDNAKRMIVTAENHLTGIRALQDGDFTEADLRSVSLAQSACDESAGTLDYVVQSLFVVMAAIRKEHLHGRTNGNAN